MVIKSASANISSKEARFTPNSLACSSDKNGSKAVTFICRPSARLATIFPILPHPIRPSVLPKTSVPINFFFSHLPACVDALACGISRASAIIIAIACSAVVMEFPKGVFITTTPASDAAALSILSVPIPARPITLSFLAFSRISLVTVVEERIASPSYSPMIFINSSGVWSVMTSTSTPRFLKISAAKGDILSLIRTFGIDVLPYLYACMFYR